MTKTKTKVTKRDHGEEKFTESVKKKYLAGDLCSCPFCGGKGLITKTETEDWGRIDIKVICGLKRCGRTWWEHYTLTDISVEG